MKQTFNLSISKPCAEKFSEFQSTSVGGFCNACQKEVIDFTQKSEEEILAYFKNQTGKTCGRFHNSQLKIYSENIPAKKPRNYNLLGVGLFSFSLFSLLSMSNSQAQQIEQPTAIHTPQKTNNKKQNTNSQTNNSEHFVQGVVIDEDNRPLPGVNIYIKGTDKGTVTDMDGKFKLSESVKTGDIIIFHTLGFIAKEIVIKENAPEIINIKMEFKECEMTLMGEVSTNEIYASKRTFWQKLTGLFR